MNKTICNGLRKAPGRQPSVEEEVLDALAEFTDALQKGEVRERLRCRAASLDLEPTAYGARLVKQVRRTQRLTQPLFARFLGVSTKTVRAWEQGNRQPGATASRFLDEIRRDPKYWAARFTAVHRA
jgi:putative transcriptional regulator